MKKWFFFLLTSSFFLVSCSKDNSNKCGYTDKNVSASATEIAYLQDYVTTHSIAATQHASGVFYVVGNPGTGAVPNVCSNVTVKYTCYVLPGLTLADSYTATGGTSFVLGQLITGWQKGIPVIKGGGTMDLYIPPSLAYGSTIQYRQDGSVAIPANSYLKFSLELLDVQ
jgi:FKBP-type peptidyl-prolyl cis-trans isomerase